MRKMKKFTGLLLLAALLLEFELYRDSLGCHAARQYHD